MSCLHCPDERGFGGHSSLVFNQAKENTGQDYRHMIKHWDKISALFFFVFLNLQYYSDYIQMVQFSWTYLRMFKFLEEEPRRTAGLAAAPWCSFLLDVTVPLSSAHWGGQVQLRYAAVSHQPVQPDQAGTQRTVGLTDAKSICSELCTVSFYGASVSQWLKTTVDLVCFHQDTQWILWTGFYCEALFTLAIKWFSRFHFASETKMNKMWVYLKYLNHCLFFCLFVFQIHNSRLLISVNQTSARKSAWCGRIRSRLGTADTFGVNWGVRISTFHWTPPPSGLLCFWCHIRNQSQKVARPRAGGVFLEKRSPLGGRPRERLTPSRCCTDREAEITARTALTGCVGFQPFLRDNELAVAVLSLIKTDKHASSAGGERVHDFLLNGSRRVLFIFMMWLGENRDRKMWLFREFYRELIARIFFF